MDVDGFTLSVDTGDKDDSVVIYLALQGMDIDRGILTQPTSTGYQSITGLSFQPSVVLFDGGDKPSGFSPYAELISGVADGTNQAGFWMGTASGDPDDTDFSTTSVIRSLTAGDPTVDAQANLSSMNTDGFTLNWTQTDSTQRKIGWIALGPANNPPTSQSVSLTNPLTGNTVVADNSTNWNFQAVVTDDDGVDDLSYVTLSLENASGSEAIKFKWTRSSDSFSEITDSQNCASIASTSADSETSGASTWVLDFKVKFNENFQAEDTEYEVKLLSVDSSLLSDEDTYPTVYKVVKAITWDGSTSTDWDAPSNWDLGVVPRSPDTVVIADVVNQPVLSTDTTVATLSISSGAALSLNGNNLTVSGNFSNEGELRLFGSESLSLTMDTELGEVVFDGGNQSISVSTTFYNFTKSVTSSATLTFEATRTQTVENTLTLQGASGNHSSRAGKGLHRSSR